MGELAEAAKGITLRAYPAPRSCFVAILEGDIDRFQNARPSTDQSLGEEPAALSTEKAP
jgi:hypothetical protein